jgi:cysteine-rich repeat protein
VRVHAGRIALEAACGAVPARTRTTRRRTVIRGRWKRCLPARRVRLRARIERGACRVMTGTIRGRGMHPWRFRALRSECGDGVVDPGNGETCDRAGCGPGETCSAECRCQPDGTSAPPPAGVCGDGIRDAGEECDGVRFPPNACTIVPGELGGPLVCTADCRIDRTFRWVCGNGRLDPLEECDDGGNASGDGCSALCAIE